MWVDQACWCASGGWRYHSPDRKRGDPRYLHAACWPAWIACPSLPAAPCRWRPCWDGALCPPVARNHRAAYRRAGPHLNTLRAAEIIVPAEVGTEDEYTFRHNLVQEAAYQSLLRDDRRDLHRAAAEALERLYPDLTIDLAHLLAHHYHEAGDTSRSLRYFVCWLAMPTSSSMPWPRRLAITPTP